MRVSCDAPVPLGSPRAFLCDVVLDGIAQDKVPILEQLLGRMGTLLHSHKGDEEPGSWTSSVGPTSPAPSDAASVFSDVDAQVTRALVLAFQELLTTERSYVRRIEALIDRYAVPLRQLALDKDTQIVPPAAAAAMFGNVADIVAANKLLLCELEVLREQGPCAMASSIGDVLLQNMRHFACYEDYINSFEHAKGTYNQMLKKKAFREFIERSQYAAKGLGNSGLRELMMEPLQRIPRYQLLIGNLVRHMPADSVQSARLQEASAAAGRIAAREIDGKTRRSAVLWSCQRAIDKFPVELVNSRRELLGCIDVDDHSVEPLTTNVLGALSSVLGAPRTKRAFALLLFDDFLVLALRTSSTPTHRLLGVQDPDKLADLMRAAQLSSPSAASRKAELVFCGMIGLGDVAVAADGGHSMRLTFARPLRSSSSKVLERTYVDAAAADTAKARSMPVRMALFSECVLRAQAVHRARGRALQLRESAVQAPDGSRALMLWTLFTRSQFARFPYKRDSFVHIGAGEDIGDLQREFLVEACLGVELQSSQTATIRARQPWGEEIQCRDVAIADLPSLCLDFLMRAPLSVRVPATTPTLEAGEAPSEVPVRRAKSLRTASRAPSRASSQASSQGASARTMSGAQRARSLVGDRVRASIQSTLCAVQEGSGTGSMPTCDAATRETLPEQSTGATEHTAAVGTDRTTTSDADRAPSRKRTVPLADSSNLSPKRRAVTAAVQGAENVPLAYPVPLEGGGGEEAAEKGGEEEKDMEDGDMEEGGVEKEENNVRVAAACGQPCDAAHVTDATAEDGRTAAHSERQSPGLEAVRKNATRSAPSNAAPSAPKDAPPSVARARQVTEEEMQEMLKPLLGQIHGVTQHQMAAAQVTEHNAVPLTAEVFEAGEQRMDALLDAEAAAQDKETPSDVSPAAAGARHDAGPVEATDTSAHTRTAAGSTRHPATWDPPAMPTPRLSEADLSQILQAYEPVHAPSHTRQLLAFPQLEAIPEAGAEIAETGARAAEADAASDGAGDDGTSPDAAEEEGMPLPAAEERTAAECRAVKTALVHVNTHMAELRGSLGKATEVPWCALKEAVRDMNRSWTAMERAYEDKQMELAALRLGPPPTEDTGVHVKPHEYAALQDEANMVLPLRLEIEQLNEKYTALAALEQETRFENTELYQTFNDELEKLYQHTFRPANDEIQFLRQSLVDAKAQLQELRVENRALRHARTVAGIR
ncbi:hypothetical protein MSPP1_001768 [Malassezia sp. CBS 17886]|nr:hypothetical protein MSPP1_001768 [Malassezia sp. CBS 17886]